MCTNQHTWPQALLLLLSFSSSTESGLILLNDQEVSVVLVGVFATLCLSSWLGLFSAFVSLAFLLILVVHLIFLLYYGNILWCCWRRHPCLVQVKWPQENSRINVWIFFVSPLQMCIFLCLSCRVNVITITTETQDLLWTHPVSSVWKMEIFEHRCVCKKCSSRKIKNKCF